MAIEIYRKQRPQDIRQNIWHTKQRADPIPTVSALGIDGKRDSTNDKSFLQPDSLSSFDRLVPTKLRKQTLQKQELQTHARIDPTLRLHGRR